MDQLSDQMNYSGLIEDYLEISDVESDEELKMYNRNI